MEERVTVSLGLPVHNGERFLEQALRSLVDQSFRDFELIISDNASTDRTASICRSFAARDDRIRYVRSDVNLGAAANFNRAFYLSSGRYFKWAAHDDVCGRDFLLRCVESLDRDPSVVLSHPVPVRIDEDGRWVRTIPSRLTVNSPTPSVRFGNVMRKSNWCLPIFGLIRREALAITQLMTGVGSDHVLLAQLSLHGRFHEVTEPLFFHRHHEDRYVRSYGTVREKASWWDPAWKRKSAVPKWNQLAGYVAAVNGAPISAKERTRCYVHISLWAMRSARPLAADLVAWPLQAVPGSRGEGREDQKEAVRQ
jgi:glycosyltransferase involved in cell wall biosynthesis